MSEPEHVKAVKAKLRDTVARLLGPPGDLLELRRLTAGATKATWAFTAQIGDTQQALILQTSIVSSRPEGTAAKSDDAKTAPAKLPTLAGEDDPPIMLLAPQPGLPLPPV